jgi:hypothetical protein
VAEHDDGPLGKWREKYVEGPSAKPWVVLIAAGTTGLLLGAVSIKKFTTMIAGYGPSGPFAALVTLTICAISFSAAVVALGQGLLILSSNSDRARPWRAGNKAERDRLAQAAANSFVAPGTTIATIPAEHPWTASATARLNRSLMVRLLGTHKDITKSFVAPANPFWTDQPVMDGIWWDYATAPENELPALEARLRAAASDRFNGWLAWLPAGDPATYEQYVRWDRRRKQSAARNNRDDLAEAAVHHRIPDGTQMRAIPADHPWALSAAARSSRNWAGNQHPIGRYTCASNPYWADDPVMDEWWWALGTCHEDHLPAVESHLVAASRGRFNAWLEWTRLNDFQTYNAYVNWVQQQEMIRQQKQMVAEQRRTTAAAEQVASEQQRLLDEQRRTTQAAQQAAASNERLVRAEQAKWDKRYGGWGPF